MNDSMTHHQTEHPSSATCPPAPIPPEVTDIRRRVLALRVEGESGRVGRREYMDRMLSLRQELREFNERQPVEGCPDWCNSHREGWALNAEDDAHRGHGMRRSGDNWYFDIDEMDDPVLGAITFAPMEYTEMSLAQAREFAVAILEALDTVEAVR